MSTENKEKDNKIMFSLDCRIYALEAIYSAAYVFVDKAYIYLEGDPKKEVAVHIKGKEKLLSEELTALAGEFQNELLNYLLRVSIAKRNQKTRDYIVGTALISASNIFGALEEEDDFEDDPLGIAVPWEEKYDQAPPLEEKNGD